MLTDTPSSLPLRASRSLDELDTAIVRLSHHLNASTYRLLTLVREFDDRLGWAKWSFPNCSEWLAWRCGLSLSAARERIRTAHALRGLPAISAAFADGRLSYSKARALTRVANAGNEDLMLAYALEASAAQVEERSRQMRNVAPDSTEGARRAWERRSLTIARNAAAGTMTVTLELPIEDGEVFARAIDRAVELGKAHLGPEFEASGWLAQQADAAIEVARSYLAGDASSPTSSADHYQVVVHVDESALRGGAGRADLPIETVRRLSCDGSIAHIVDNLTLLCTQHHRLLHEGRFRIRHDVEGALYFERSDGRVIPRGGYRMVDVYDDGADDGSAPAASVEQLLQRLVRSRKPSAEVREPRGSYELRLLKLVVAPAPARGNQTVT